MRIKQVLSNLVSNALKNTTQGYVEISYETGQSETRISVSDTGRGIPQEKLGVIFERFEKRTLSYKEPDWAYPSASPSWNT